MVISILGCGWYGEALAVALLRNGTTVKGSVTSAIKFERLRALNVQPYVIRFDSTSQIIDPAFFECDIMVICITPKLKTGGEQTYLHKIRCIIQTCVQYGVKKVIYVSSTGVYGDHNSEVNELNHPKSDTASGSILAEAEELFSGEPGFKTTILRFGGLIGPGRHPGRFFAGKINIPNGQAPVNLIHQQDCVAITERIIEQDAFGNLFNAVSPDHPIKSAFYREMSAKTSLPQPEFIDELKNWKIVNSINLSKILGYILDRLMLFTIRL